MRSSSPGSARRWTVVTGLVVVALCGGGRAVAGPGAAFGRASTATSSDAIPAPADPATVPGYDADPWSLLGPSRLVASDLAAFVQHRQTHTTVPIGELAAIYLQEGAALGVRADIAWAQSVVETAAFRFPGGGLVHPDDNNFAGIGACDSCAHGHRYATARDGVRAQMQLLRGYADPLPLAGAGLHPPVSLRGSAPTWWDMGSGRWATATNYAAAVTSTYNRMLVASGFDPLTRTGHASPVRHQPARAVIDASTVGTAPGASARTGDGLYLADATGQIYDVGDARFWGSAAGTLDHSRIVGVAITPGARGYWEVLDDGRTMAFGDAPDLGAAPRDTVAVAAIPNGLGYFTVTSHGAVRAFGAAHLAPTAPLGSSAQIVAIASTPSGAGCWLLDALGAVVALGDAHPVASATIASPADPAVGFAPVGDHGYRVATASGRVQAIGVPGITQSLTEVIGARAAQQRLVIAIVETPSHDGYWLVTTAGDVVGVGAAPTFPATPTGATPVLAAAGRTT